MVQRDGEVRASVMPVVTAKNVRDALLANVATKATLMSDESPLNAVVGRPFAQHGTVPHSRHEYVRGLVHSKSVESFSSRLKRKMYGTHHAVSPKHLHRYVAELAFKHHPRHREDGERTVRANKGGDGKRLRRSVG